MVKGLTPTVFVMVNPLPPVSDAVRAKGVACVTADDFRWQKAHIKSTSLLGAVLARQISVEAGAAPRPSCSAASTSARPRRATCGS
jgi:D-alanine transaminase